MNKNIILQLVLLFPLIFLINSQFVNGYLTLTTFEEALDYHIFHMPFEYAEVESHTGIASLAMMFQYYGCTIDQMVINEISGTNEGVVRGTPLNGYIKSINYDNYTGRDYGYEVNVSLLTDYSSIDRWNILKDYVRHEIPVVLGTRFAKTGNYYIHYRILIGYDERTKVLIFNDPYQGRDASTGPYSDFPYSSFSSRWANTDYLLIQINPIKLKLDILNKSIEPQSNFELKCQINCSNLNNTPSEVNINLELPSGYSITNGQLFSQLNAVQGSNIINWTIQSSENASLNDEIKVKVNYPNGNYTFGNYETVRPYESMIPHISAPSTNSSFDQDYVSPEFIVEGSISYNISVPYDVYLITYDYRVYPDYIFHKDFLGSNQELINWTLGPYNENETLIFCWFSLETSYGKIYESAIKLYRVLILKTTSTTTTTDQIISLNSIFVLLGTTALSCIVYFRRKRKMCQRS